MCSRTSPHRIPIVLGRNLLPLPMHPGRLPVVDLHPVHAHIAFTVARVARHHARQRDKPPAIVRPALQNRKLIQVKTIAQNHFLARGVFPAHRLRKCARQCAQLRQHFELVKKSLRRFQIQQASDPLCNLIQPFHAQRQRHPPLTAELIDEDFMTWMPLDVLKQQRRPACGILARAKLRYPVGNLGNLQLRRDFSADALEFASLFQCFDPLAQVVVSHRLLQGQGFFPLHTTAFACHHKKRTPPIKAGFVKKAGTADSVHSRSDRPSQPSERQLSYTICWWKTLRRQRSAPW